MEEYVIKHKNILFSLVIRLLPLFLSLLVWVDILNIKQQWGINYFSENMNTSIIGFVIVIIAVFLRTKISLRVLMNLVGNIILWVPVLYSSFKESNNLAYLTIWYYLTLFIVLISIVLQTLMLVKIYKLEIE